ncbi:YbjN domain-containing protein [Mycobacterium decipiens]|nr:YbjN domain-containing protein [Mycobacterium decipiens]
MIERFDRRMIEQFLREKDIRYLTDEEGDFIVDFYGDDMPDYRLELSALGGAEVLSIRIFPVPTYPEEMRDRIEGFVAGWNRRTRWPKAYITDDPRGRGIDVYGESAFPLGPGVHQALLEHFIGTTWSAGYDMLTELARAVDAPGGGTPETWVPERG